MSIDRFWILVARKLSGESSVEEIRELQDLLRIHPHLYFSVEIITNLWNQQAKKDEKKLDDAYASHIERMNNMGISFHQEANKNEGDIPFLLHGSRKNRIVRKLVIAASVVIVLSASFFFYSNKKKPSQSTPEDLGGLAAVATKYGSRTNIQLPDGSKVWLNSGSRITYNKQFGKDIREVDLSGEAYFDVVKNPEKPFIIHTTSMDIKVLGTQFNVKSYANDKLSEASLIHGSIEVSLKKRGSEKILLKPNEKIVVMNERLVKKNAAVLVKSNPAEPIIVVQKLNYTTTDSTIIETSWVENKLIFSNESLEEIAVKMERWFGMAVEFKDPSFKSERFTGTFTNETIQQALEALQITINFQFTIKDNTIIITK
jgi:transmembrane sensor